MTRATVDSGATISRDWRGLGCGCAFGLVYVEEHLPAAPARRLGLSPRDAISAGILAAPPGTLASVSERVEYESSGFEDRDSVDSEARLGHDSV